MDKRDNITHRCGECKGYNANYCNIYDEVTKEDSEVHCIGFDPKSICESCCYREDFWCDFYKTQASKTKTDCEAWEPKIEL